MKAEKAIILNKEEYDRIIPRIGYYMKSKNIARIFKEKCPIFAAGGEEEIINLFSNSLQWATSPDINFGFDVYAQYPTKY